MECQPRVFVHVVLLWFVTHLSLRSLLLPGLPSPRDPITETENGFMEPKKLLCVLEVIGHPNHQLTGCLGLIP